MMSDFLEEVFYRARRFENAMITQFSHGFQDAIDGDLPCGTYTHQQAYDNGYQLGVWLRDRNERKVHR